MIASDSETVWERRNGICRMLLRSREEYQVSEESRRYREDFSSLRCHRWGRGTQPGRKSKRSFVDGEKLFNPTGQRE